MTAIIDYGVGNLFSLRCSLQAVGEEVVVTADPAVLAAADRVILPGVGAFADAAEKLRATGLDKTVKALAAAGKPLLGICLGMQLLFEKSYEFGEHEGLGLLPGAVRPIAEKIPAGLKIPHIGWNGLHFPEGKRCPLFADLSEGDCVYFVHSYAAVGCEDVLTASTEYGASLTAAAAKGSVYGCQFHPEKSGAVGMKILRAFCRL